MKQTTFVLIDNLAEFSKYADEIQMFIESVPDRHSYKIHPKLLQERFKYENIIIVLQYLDNQINSYIVLNLFNASFDLRLSVKKILGISVEQANYIGSIILKKTGEVDHPLVNALNMLLQNNREVDIINFNEIRLDSEPYDTLTTRVINGCKLFNTSEKLEKETELVIHSSFLDFLNGFKAKSRYTLNRNIKQFRDASNGDFEIKKIINGKDIDKFYQDLEKVYINTWQAATFGSRPRCTSRETAIPRIAAEHGWFRSYMLYLESSPIAFAVGFQYGNTYYLDEIGYDLKYKNMSAGNFLIYSAIEDIMTNNVPQVINFGYGENLYKKIYGNTEVPATNLLLIKNNSLASIVARAQLILNVVYRFIYKVLIKYKLDSFFRKLLKNR